MIRSAIRAALAAVLSPATGRGQQYVGQTLDLGFDNDTYRILADGTLVSKKFSDIVTFSRASNATRFSPTGQLQYAPHNLLLQSQTFDNASWSKTNSSITANAATAPDGTLTGDKHIPDNGATIGAGATDTRVYQSPSVTSGSSYTLSIYAKAGEYDQLAIAVITSPTNSAIFSLTLGTVVSGAGATITSVGNGWYRCTLTFTATSTGSLQIRWSSESSTVSTGDGTSGIYIWGAQLAVGPNALDYTPTTTAVVYGPRFDYDPTTLEAKGLLIEEQRTNSVLYSEQFDNAVWTKTRSSITSNTVVAPDGTLTGDALITDTTVTDTHRIELLSVAFTSGTTYTLTLFAKAQSSLNLQLVFLTSAFGTSLRAAFNLQTGQTLVSSSSITAKTTNVGNGWFRCEATATATATATSGFHISLINTFAATAAATSFTGDGTSGIYIWGAQLEAGAFATSYIPTTTAATTRSADIASIDTLSPWYNSVEMTVYTEYDIIGKTTTSGFATEIDDGTLNNRIINIGQEIGVGDVKLGSFMNSGGSTSVNDYPITAMNVGSVYKLAFAVKSNDAATVANGISVLDATAVIPSGLTTLRLGRRITDRYLNGHLRRITYTPRRLTDAELQSLTS